MIAPLAQAMNSPSENVNEIVRLTLGVKRVKIKISECNTYYDSFNLKERQH